MTDCWRRMRAPHARPALAAAAVAACLVASGCGVSTGRPVAAGSQTVALGARPSASAQPSATAQPSAGAQSPAGAQPSAGAQSSATARPSRTAKVTGTAAVAGDSAAGPLAGKIIGIDPGHNGRNNTDPSYINHLIWNGREWETCDTTGTETDSGYTEALFTWRVARFLRADLRRDGARVVMTRKNNRGVGPCVNRRARIINRGHANVAVDIHGDGGPASGRGFAILEPVRDGPNDKVIRSSGRLGRDVRRAFLNRTSMPESTYDGVHGITHRNDLAGLNLTRVPKVLIECGNMRNATDARLLTSARFQRRIARVLRAAIIRFLRH
jgi:N-acetylmuramoyl-L-alanine amidase